MFNNTIQPTTPACNVVLVPPQQWSPQNPPPYNAVSGIPNQLHNAMPVIASTLMNKLSQNATESYPFCFLYNRVTMNGMRNSEWQRLLEATVFHTWFNINTRTFATEDEALQKAIRAVILAYSSHISVQDPAMRGWLTISQQEEVKAMAQHWPTFCQEYLKLEQQSRAVQGQAMAGPSGLSASPIASQWATGAPAADAGMAGFAPTGSWGNPEPAKQQQQRQASFYDEPAEDIRPRRREMFVPGVSPESHRPAAPVVKEPPKASFLSAVTHVSAQGRVNRQPINQPQKASAGEWEPTPYQPYHPAYRTGQQALYEYHNDANQIRRVIAIINQDTEMDRNQHAFSSRASFAAFYGNHQQPPEMKIQEALSTTAKAIMEDNVGENEGATALYKALGVIDNEPVEIDPQTSLRALIAEARSFRVVSEDSGPTFIVGSGIGHLIVSKTNHADLIESLAKAGSLAKAAKILNDAFESVKANPSQDRRGYLDFILGLDRLLRNELLQVIRFRMGVGEDFKFDSFMEDEADVRATLKSAYGVSYEQSYLKLESHLLIALFSAELVHVAALNAAEDKPPAGWVTSISPMVTLLLMDISDEQFGLQLPDGAVCEVFEDTFPGLFEFIKSVVSNNAGALHHYIVTNDDVVYEVNVGLVGNNKHMVVTRVNRASMGV